MPRTTDTNAFLWACAPGEPEGASLRVGVLVETGDVEAWVAACCAELARVPRLSIELCPVEVVPVPAPSRVVRRFEAIGGDGEATARVPLDQEIRTLAREGAALARTPRGELDESARRTLAGAGYDVVVALGVGALVGPCPALGRHGVWTVTLGDLTLGPGSGALFENLARRAPLLDWALVRHDEGFHEGRVLQTWTTLQRSSIHWSRNAGSLYAVPSVLSLELLRLAGGRSMAREDVLTTRPAPPIRLPEFLGFARRAGLAKVRARLGGTAPGAGEWRILTRPTSGDDEPQWDRTPWQAWPGMPGHGEADPFFMEYEGKRALLYEDIQPPTGRGRLAGAEIDGDGRLGDPFVVLDEPYHLSYPHAFLHDGACYMIPESAENRTVDLYKAVDFPRAWALERTLIRNVLLVDTTPLHLDGVWYFFTTMRSRGEELVSLLFTAEALDAPWRLHPASPIATDVRASRSAGAIVRAEGRLFRPVQRCWPIPGIGVRFHEILELTPTRFRETCAGEYVADAALGQAATHTFARSPYLEATDVRPTAS